MVLGDIIAYSVKTYFEQPSVQELIQELQDSGVNMTYLGVTKDDSAASGHVLSSARRCTNRDFRTINKTRCKEKL